jgi:hypothetical protein
MESSTSYHNYQLTVMLTGPVDGPTVVVVSNFSGAAPKAADQRLFSRVPSSLQRLNKNARQGLRNVARAAYWKAKQEAEAAASQDTSSNG